jgi:signal peptidase
MRVVRVLGNVAMLLLCLLAVGFAALSLLSRGDPSDTRTWAGGYKPFVVLSGSMEPAIPVGGVLLVRRVAAADVRRGDIITFVTPREPSASPQAASVTTHRVVAVQAGQQGQPTFATKGDANENADPMAVPAQNVLGSAVFAMPYLGYVSRFASTKFGLLLLIVGPALLLIAMEVVSMVRRRSRNRPSRAARENS